MKTLKFTAISAVAFCCSLLFAGCHVLPWYIPKPYSEKEQAEIYEFIKQDMLTELSQYIAGVGIVSNNGDIKNYTVFFDEGQVIIELLFHSADDTISYGVWYDGTLKLWDETAQVETVSEVSISEYSFLFERIEETAEFFRTRVIDVASYRDDSYFWECFPHGFGMAMMYYDDIDGMSVNASWTVEKKSAVEKENLPLVYDAKFYCGNGDDHVSITIYPFKMEESIANILDTYEKYKIPPEN